MRRTGNPEAGYAADKKRVTELGICADSKLHGWRGGGVKRARYVPVRTSVEIHEHGEARKIAVPIA